MADKYIKDSFQTLRVKMGTSQDSLQNAVQLYNEGQLTSSAEIFEDIAQRDSSNTKAITNAGIAYLRLGNYDKALVYFQQLEKYTSLYINPGKFLHALTLLKRNQPGDKQQARQLLQQVVDNDLEEKETAKQWLDKKW
jgi:tetratricopeptide (TPR) repeat protein